jgi:hypothetical protein
MRAVLVYGPSSSNLGDIIQTIALTRYFPQTVGIFREHIRDFRQISDLFIVNGFLYDLPHLNKHVLFAGIHPFLASLISAYTMKKQLLGLKQSLFPVGARDPAAQKELESLGINSEMIGCSTLTFERYKGPRHGIYSVDFNGPGTHITHRIPAEMSVAEQWQLALKHLNYYRTAERVYTSRLHVALPCLAFGTPVCFSQPHKPLAASRFSLLRYLGVESGKLCMPDASKIKKKYLDFLRTYAGSFQESREPILPLLVDAPPKNTRLRNLTYRLRTI